MLMLILSIVSAYYIQLYLNTSLVNVNLFLHQKVILIELNLNTSHVNVNQVGDVATDIGGKNLNTSHVNVNQRALAKEG